jgi:hypothetical protein
MINVYFFVQIIVRFNDLTNTGEAELILEVFFSTQLFGGGFL